MSAPEEIIDDSPVAPAGVGDRLRAAREAAGLSCGDVAQALKFSPKQIELIEANAWSLLPGQTFVRGFVRNYARFLKLDADALLSDLESAALPKAPILDMPRSTAATLPHQGGVQKNDRAAVIGGLVVAVFSALAYFFVPDDLWSGELGRLKVAILGAPSEVAPPSAPVTAPVVVKDLSKPADSGVPPVPSAAEPPTPPAAVGASSGAAVSAPAGVSPAGPLRFEFDKASWIEVRDAKGAVILSQQGSAGTTRDVEGDPPFSVVIGDGRSVRLTYRDHPIDLGPFINVQSNVARLTIE